MLDNWKGGDGVSADAYLAASSFTEVTTNNRWHNVFSSARRGGEDTKRVRDEAP